MWSTDNEPWNALCIAKCADDLWLGRNQSHCFTAYKRNVMVSDASPSTVSIPATSGSVVCWKLLAGPLVLTKTQKLSIISICAVLTFPSTFFCTNQQNIKHQQHCGGAVVECLFWFNVTSYMLAGGIPLWSVSPSFHVSNGNKRKIK